MLYKIAFVEILDQRRPQYFVLIRKRQITRTLEWHHNSQTVLQGSAHALALNRISVNNSHAEGPYFLIYISLKCFYGTI